MEPSELLELLAKKLDQLKLPYFVTGSMATIIYGEPRYTNDIDVVINLQEDNVEALCQSFPAPDYYVSQTAMNSAIHNCRPFNIIHPASGLKIDVMVPEDTAFNKSRFKRKQRINISDDTSVWFAAPEDVILKKMSYYHQGASEKHIRDILGVMKIQQEHVDWEYIDHWADKLELSQIWQTIKGEFEKDS